MHRFTVLLFLLASPICHAQFSYVPINVPGAVSTEARGINNKGEIVGFYKTAARADYDPKVPNCPTKGFKYVNGSYIKLMVPAASAPQLWRERWGRFSRLLLEARQRM